MPSSRGKIYILRWTICWTILIVHHDLRKVHSYFDSVLLLNKEVIAFGDTESTFTRVNLTTAYGTDLFFTGGENND